MKALTICQGWADLVFHPHHPKDIENRSWPTSYRGPLLIHAGKSKKQLADAQFYCDFVGISYSEPIVFGAIIGIVDLVGCTLCAQSIWAYPNQHHWEFANPRLFAEPIACKGALSLWVPPIEVLEKVRQQLENPVR